MKFLVPLLALTTLALAQEVEPVPAEKTLAIATKLTATLGTPGDAPLAVEVNTEKAVAIKAGPGGLLAMPDKKLTAETLAAAGKEQLPLGQLWMHKMVPEIQHAPAPASKLRTVTVNDGNDDARAEVYYLGVAKAASGGLELSLFGKDKTALVTVPLAKTDAAANATPFALDGHKDGDHSGTLVITIFGSYKADVTVTRPAE